MLRRTNQLAIALLLFIAETAFAAEITGILIGIADGDTLTFLDVLSEKVWIIDGVVDRV